MGTGWSGFLRGRRSTVVIAGMGGQLVIHILETGGGLWGDVEALDLVPPVGA